MEFNDLFATVRRQAPRRHSPYSHHNDIITIDSSSSEEDDDTKLARELQSEFDREYAQQLQNEYKKSEKNKKSNLMDILRSPSPLQLPQPSPLPGGQTILTNYLHDPSIQRPQHSHSRSRQLHNLINHRNQTTNNHYHQNNVPSSLHNHRNPLNMFNITSSRSLANSTLDVSTARLMFSDRDFTADDYETLLRLDEKNTMNKGLNSNEIQSFPCFNYTTSNTVQSSDDSTDKTCTICQDDYKSNEKLLALTCLHKFHKKCIITWLKDSRTCPLCLKDALTGN